MTDPQFLILVVDDHEPNRDLLSRRLTRNGYQVMVAATGLEALERVKQHRVDLVLLDIMMPGMSGLEVLETLRQTRSAVDLPVIMATARPESDDLVAALDRGASDYVTKPIQIEILLARLRVQLRERLPGLGRRPTPMASPAVTPEEAARALAQAEADLDEERTPGPADMTGGVPGPLPAPQRPVTPVTVLVGPAAGHADGEPAPDPQDPRRDAATATGEKDGASSVPARWIGPGAVIEGRYRLEACIGQGGFGAVYRAYHLVLETPLAIKFMHQNLVTSGPMLRRFQIEGISACRVKHPNAVAVLDAGSFNGFPFLVMELLEGTSLSQLLERERIVRLARAASIIGPVCDVLIEAHRAGIVHRDIKPANIMLATTPRGEVVKVLDFGVARLLDGAPRRPLMSKGESLIGTPQYMAPERLMGQPADASSDIYSVGATLYEMISGELPWGRSSNLMAQAYRQVRDEPTPIGKRRTDLPGPLADLISRAIGRDVAARPSLEELGSGVRSWAEQFTEPEWPPPGMPGIAATYTSTLVLKESDVVSESHRSGHLTSPELPAARAVARGETGDEDPSPR